MREITEYYGGRDLGCTYSKAESVFKLWAPGAAKVTLALYEDAGCYNADGQVIDHAGGLEIGMKKWKDGVWFLRFSGDLAKVLIICTRSSTRMEPSAMPPIRIRKPSAPTAPGRRSWTWKPGTRPAGKRTAGRPWQGAKTPFCTNCMCAIFRPTLALGFQHKGKFKAFTETGLRDKDGNAIGIDHLEELGVTHVHLLPVFDFQTVNELQADDPGASGPKYNWGYDPQHFNVPEGSYATDPTVPGLRIREFKEMVMALHGKGIRVVMDVVYNHTYSVEDGPFEAVVPGYFYRRDAEGRLANGSGVGNELATERPMVRKFILDSVRYWADEYHIDGFRLDLMGLIDTDTVKLMVEELRREADPAIIVYGEPWTGGESPLGRQTLKGSQRNLGFAVFNDHFRGAIKGDSDGEGKGFATGGTGTEAAVLEGVRGSIGDFADVPLESVNYVTVHDNLNLWDKVLTTQGLRDEAKFPDIRNGELVHGGSLHEAVENSEPYRSIDGENIMKSETVKRALLANGIVLTSQGIPLIHAGDELLRTKYGDHNSYRSGDAVNAIRWENKRRFRLGF